MGITSGDIERVTFSPARHGYDTDEDDGYLQQVAAEVDEMNDELAASRAEVAELKRQLAAGGDAGEPARADEDDGLF
ncbi:MAG: DivIVA domain-containing protein [Olsenella sp.]